MASKDRRVFIGRTADLAAVEEHVQSGSALLTITGPGGMGKTALVRRYFDGVHEAWRKDGGTAVFCDLTQATDRSTICATLANAIGVPLPESRDEAETPERLGRVLSAMSPALVVLDNFEQVAAFAADTVGTWVASAPEVQFIVTSRERLRLAEEVVHELGALSLPTGTDSIAESEAVALWMARVRAQQPGYSMSSGDEPTIAALVRALDGIPLAIELAAARSLLLGPVALLERLSRRFEVLRRGRVDGKAQHATLQTAIDWSWDLLGPVERAALAQCAAFRGGFTANAAEAVVDLRRFADAPPVLDVLQSLREKSLLRSYEPDGWPGETRLGMYLSIAEYAEARLVETNGDAGVYTRHGAYYAAYLGELLGRADRAAPLAALARATPERENAHAAILRCIGDAASDSSAVASAVELLLALDPDAWPHDSLSWLLEQLTRALATPAATTLGPALRARALLLRGRVSMRRGKPHDAGGDWERAIELARGAKDVGLESLALRNRAQYLAGFGLPAEARATAEQALALAQRTGDRALEAWAHHGLGWVLREQKRLSDARRHCERALELAREVGDARKELFALVELTSVHVDGGQSDVARRHAEEMIAASRALSSLEGWVQFILGLLEHGASCYEAAAGRYGNAQKAARMCGDLRIEAFAGAYASFALWEDGHADEALGAMGEAFVLMDRFVGPPHSTVSKAFFGAMEASSGAVAEGRRRLEEARREIERFAHGTQHTTVDLAFGLLELKEAETLASEGKAGEAAAVRADVERRLELARMPSSAEEEGGEGGRSPAARSMEVRLAGRLVDHALRRRPAGAPPSKRTPLQVVAIDGEARWFEAPGIGRVECARRPIMRRMLLALAGARLQQPGRALSADELLQAGWPGERIHRQAALNRLHAMVSRMREMGLRDVLQTKDDGYWFDPGLDVRLVPSK